jgi:hypothetical protein
MPIVAKNLDVLRLVMRVQKLLNLGRQQHGARIVRNDSYDDEKGNISYMIDYETNSAMSKDGKAKGSVYIRGIKDPKGDKFKFVLEKATDFCDIDAELMIAVA